LATTRITTAVNFGFDKIKICYALAGEGRVVCVM